MVIVNMDCIIYLYRIANSLEDVGKLEAVRESAIREGLEKEKVPEREMQIKLDKIIVCAKVPQNSIILSGLATVYVNLSPNQINLVIPDL